MSCTYRVFLLVAFLFVAPSILFASQRLLPVEYKINTDPYRYPNGTKPLNTRGLENRRCHTQTPYAIAFKKELDESFNWLANSFLKSTPNPLLRQHAAQTFEVMKKDPYCLTVHQGRREKSFAKIPNAFAFSTPVGVYLPLSKKIGKRSTLDPICEVIAACESTRFFLLHNSALRNLSSNEKEFQAHSWTGLSLIGRKKTRALAEYLVSAIVIFCLERKGLSRSIAAINIFRGYLSEKRHTKPILKKANEFILKSKKLSEAQIYQRLTLVKNWKPVSNFAQAEQQLKMMEMEMMRQSKKNNCQNQEISFPKIIF